MSDKTGTEPKRRRRSGLGRSDYVRAAFEILDADGAEAVTTRALGERLAVEHTQIYRHFPNKDGLLDAMVDDLFGGVIDQTPVGETPRQRLEDVLRRLRTALEEHPHIVQPLVNSRGTMPNGGRLTRMVVGLLEEMGLSGRDLVIAYMNVEGFGMGTGIFDMTGAPTHVETRRMRFRLLGHPAFDDVSRDDQDIVLVTRESFERGMRTVLDAAESRAARV